MKTPSLPEYFAQYVNFIIDFIIDIKKCCQPYQDNKIVEKDLLTFAFFSTVIAWLQIYTIKKIGHYYGDTNSILNAVQLENLEFISLYLLAFLMVYSFCYHFFVIFIFRIKESIDVKNTINGILVFYSGTIILVFFLFMLTIIFCFQVKSGGILFFGSSIINAILIFALLYKKFKPSLVLMHPETESNNKYFADFVNKNIIFIALTIIIPLILIKFLGDY